MIAKKMYKAIGVDTDLAIQKISSIPLSIQCWQLDDVTGFEGTQSQMNGGIAVTGSHPGKPISLEAFKQDLLQVIKLVPGKKKINLHAIYLDSKDKIERNEIDLEHFDSWIDFAKQHNVGLDFNPTCFSHELSRDGFTLSHPNDNIRNFWIEHIKRTRKISAYMGEKLGIPSIHNIWIPDGFKDVSIDKVSYQRRLRNSLDEIYSIKYDSKYIIDALESKLFGIGSESFVIGSHEFYMNYTETQKNVIICLDVGHFHPSETVSNKLSSFFTFDKSILLHVSRPVRWDSDHVVLLDDETIAIMQEIVRANALDKVHIAMDFFDGSIHRVTATILGARNTQKALLKALLEPTNHLMKLESDGDFTRRLVCLEELKTMPFGFVWDYFCELNGVPTQTWVEAIKEQ